MYHILTIHIIYYSLKVKKKFYSIGDDEKCMDKNLFDMVSER